MGSECGSCSRDVTDRATHVETGTAAELGSGNQQLQPRSAAAHVPRTRRQGLGESASAKGVSSLWVDSWAQCHPYCPALAAISHRPGKPKAARVDRTLLRGPHGASCHEQLPSMGAKSSLGTGGHAGSTALGGSSKGRVWWSLQVSPEGTTADQDSWHDSRRAQGVTEPMGEHKHPNRRERSWPPPPRRANQAQACSGPEPDTTVELPSS